jgi:NAD+ synthase
LNLTSDVLDFDVEEVDRRLCHFIKDYVEKAGTQGIVIGLSGGVDSSTLAALTARAIGGSNVLGLMLFEKETRRREDIVHAQAVGKKFGLETKTVDLTPVLKSFTNSTSIFDPTDKLCNGNVKARTRMIYIYYYANRLSRIVCGSSDKSETMMGYFTKWGDIAADISPLMDLYKTQVRKLAKHIGVPQGIIEKPSSPVLWPGQLAENELGIKYEQLDRILFGLERFMTTKDIAAQLRLKKPLVDRIKTRWLSAEHKRRTLLTAKLEYRTIGADFRLQRDPL